MQEKSLLSFDAYQLDPTNVRLWRGKHTVNLPPKVFGLLHYLVERPGQLVTKAELFQAVWPETVVTDSALTVCMKELRKALRDDAKFPRYIETVHRRGYRFIAPLSTASPVLSPESRVLSLPPPTPYTLHPTPSLVGREAELAQLHRWLDKALSGERQVGFVIGEAGIGKTTLVEAFLAQLGARDWGLGASPLSSPKPQHPAPSTQHLTPSLWIGRGQCIEHYGPGEAYRPVLEALGRLCRGPGGKRLIALLERHAPTWLVQMPALVSPARLRVLQKRGLGATKERMLRELVEALEAITRERPLVLVLEDLHWSDAATLELLALLARRRETARLLVLATYRPVEVLVREHPLRAVKQELQLHGHCQEMLLDFLSVEGVAEYLRRRFGDTPPALALSIHQRTSGNPLFMVNVVDYVVAQGLIAEGDDGWKLEGSVEDVAGGVPESLRQLIEKQLERLGPEDRHILEVASVAGVEFSAAVVAAGREEEVVQVEERCEELVRRNQFLQARGIEEWPDGTVASRYSFIHALYQEVLYGRVTGARRVQLHQKIGEREEAGYRGRAEEIAAALAVHFERGRDYHRAVQYLQQAGENAIRRSAHQEAINLLTKGLTLLEPLPDTAERAQQELSLQTALGASLIAAKGYAAAEVEHAYTRARELCQQIGETPQIIRALFGLWSFYVTRGQHQIARGLGEQLLNLGQRVQDPSLRMAAYHAPGESAFWMGEFARAREYLEWGIAQYGPHNDKPFVFGPGMNLWEISFSSAAFASFPGFVLWHLGYPDQALRRVHESLTQAHKLAHPFSLAYAFVLAGWLHQFRRERHAVQERAEAAITLATEQGFPEPLAWGTIQRGWALATQGQTEKGIAQVRQGLDIVRNIGSEVMLPYLLALLAETYGNAGQAEEGLSALDEALSIAKSSGERHYEAELYRLKGELTLQKFQVPGFKFQEGLTPPT
jgi:DNA-binding winged helix-turn-helix (wHTH) protein/predicted ATPase